MSWLRTTNVSLLYFTLPAPPPTCKFWLRITDNFTKVSEVDQCRGMVRMEKKKTCSSELIKPVFCKIFFFKMKNRMEVWGGVREHFKIRDSLLLSLAYSLIYCINTNCLCISNETNVIGRSFSAGKMKKGNRLLVDLKICALSGAVNLFFRYLLWWHLLMYSMWSALGPTVGSWPSL